MYNKYRDKEKRKAYMRKYMQKYNANKRAKGLPVENPDYHKNLRIKALQKFGELKCCDCGCNHYDILEINHIKGDGRKDTAFNYSKKQFYRDLISGKISIEGFNILCRVCNAKHYVQELLGIKGHSVSWFP